MCSIPSDGIFFLLVELALTLADTGATPMTAELPISQTYTAKPSRNSGNYAQGLDLSMGAQRPTAALAGPPSSFRTQQEIMASYGSQPQMASSSRRESEGLINPSSNASSRAPTVQNSYSTSNSPNLNRHSYTMGPGHQAPQPPRPVRSGTLPQGEHPGAVSSNGNHYRDIGRSSSNGSSGNGTVTSISTHVPQASGGLTSPTPLEQSFDSKVGLGPVIPVQPDAQKDAPPTMRARSGTGKSSKDKKSMFGVLSGT